MAGKWRRGVLAALIVFVCASAFARMGRGGVTSSSPGFLPSGHYIVAKQAMIQIFPRPDAETASYAREHQAYIGEPYDLAMGVAFGAYPFICTLVSGPPGMVVLQSTYNTFQNKNYCRVSWTPTSSWNGEAEVQVTDQQHNSIYLSWALWTVGQYTTSSFSGTGTVASGSTVFTVNSTTAGAVTPGMIVSGTAIPANDYITTGSGTTWTLAIPATGNASAESISGSYQGGAVFVSPTGTGSTCTYAAPCLPSTAFGATFAATTFPGAVAYAFGGSYSGSANLPAYTDNDIYGSGSPVFEPENAKKPAALIGIPGQTPTFDASANNYFLSTNINAADWYMENITANGYDASGIHPRLIDMEGGGSVNGTFRQTYDQISWENSGYGAGTSGNESMFYSAAVSTSSQYLFITDSTESNRESGAVGNNYGFCDIYSETNGLIQRGTENSPSANMDAVFYLKSDDQDIDLRENFASVSGASHGFDIGQSGPVITQNDEIDYNIGINVDGIYMPDTSGFTWGNIWVLRNSLISTHGLTSNDPNNASGYFEFDSNAVQTTATPQPISGTAIHCDGGGACPGLNQTASSGMLSTSTGLLTGAYANPPSGGGILGTVGAQISATP